MNAWILTHDNIIDHRIFFFPKVLKKLGFEIAIFGGFADVSTIVCDSHEIIRPESRTTLTKDHITQSESLYRDIPYFEALRLQKFALKLSLSHQVFPNTRDALVEAGFKLTPGINIEFAKSQNVMTYSVFGTNGFSRYEFSTNSWIITQRNIFLSFSAEEIRNFHLQEWDTFIDKIYDFTPIFQSCQSMAQRRAPDLIYVADLPCLPLAFQIKKEFGSKLIVDCHEWWMQQSNIWEPIEKRKIALIDNFERRLYPLCDARLTVGVKLSQSMSDYFGVGFETIYTCPATNEVRKPLESRRKYWKNRFNFSKTCRTVIFQGSLTTHRNLDNLARATAYLPDNIKLVVVGDGPYRDEFYKILKSEGNPDAVSFTGWVSQKELAELTSHADLGILPYVSENDYYSRSTPNKLLEYINAELPFIFDPSLIEINFLNSKFNMAIPADCRDPRSLATSMHTYSSDDMFLNELQKNATGAKAHLGEEMQSDKFKSIIGTILNE